MQPDSRGWPPPKEKFATLGGHSKERAEAVEHATAVEKIELASIHDCETLSFPPF